MAKTFIYNAYNQSGSKYLLQTDLIPASVSTAGIVKLATYSYTTPGQVPTNVVYDKAAVDELVSSATGGGITNISKGAGSSASFTVTRNGTDVTLTIPQSSTAQSGLVQLSDSLTSVVSTTAATSKAVADLKTTVDTKISGININGSTSNNVTNLVFTGTAGVNITPGVIGASTTLTLSLDVPEAKTALGLGTAAYVNTGVASGNIPVLGANGKLSDTVLPSVAFVDTFPLATAATMADILTFINGVSSDPKPEKGDIIVVAAGAMKGSYIILTTKTPGSYVAADITLLQVPAGEVTSLVYGGTTYNPTNGVITVANTPWSMLTGIPDGSTTTKGIVQTTATVTTSTSLVPTAKAVQDYVTSQAYTLPAATTTILGGVKIGTNISVDSSGLISIADSTTTVKGLVQLTDSTSSTSKTTAATADAVRLAFVLAQGKLSVTLATSGTAVTTAKLSDNTAFAYTNKTASDIATVGYVDNALTGSPTSAISSLVITKTQLTSGTVGSFNTTGITGRKIVSMYLTDGATNTIIPISGYSKLTTAGVLDITIFDPTDTINTIYDGALANANSTLTVVFNKLA